MKWAFSEMRIFPSAIIRHCLYVNAYVFFFFSFLFVSTTYSLLLLIFSLFNANTSSLYLCKIFFTFLWMCLEGMKQVALYLSGRIGFSPFFCCCLKSLYLHVWNYLLICWIDSCLFIASAKLILYCSTQNISVVTDSVPLDIGMNTRTGITRGEAAAEAGIDMIMTNTVGDIKIIVDEAWVEVPVLMVTSTVGEINMMKSVAVGADLMEGIEIFLCAFLKI